MIVDIRLASVADAAAIADLYRPAVETTAISFEVRAPSAAEMAKRVAETLETYPWLVCTRAGVLVGYAYANRHRVREAYRWSVDTSVYVDRGHHRSGVGRGLYTSLVALLAAQGYCNAFAGITLPNPASVALHESLGFQPIGIYRRVGHKCGRWHDVGWWQLTLGEERPSPREPLTIDSLQRGPQWRALIARGIPRVRRDR